MTAARLSQRAVFYLSACVIGMLLPLVAPLFRTAESSVGMTLLWLVDLGTHWQLLYMALLAFIVSIQLTRTRDWRWAVPLLLCALPVISAAPGASHAEADGSEVFAVASANMWIGNSDAGPLVKWLVAEESDVAILVEVTDEVSRQLQAVGHFPHRHVVPGSDPFGLAILSRHPIESVEFANSADRTPSLRAIVQWRGRQVAVTATHPMPPISAQFTRQRDAQLRDDARWLQERKLPAVMAGDLNATVWSTAFVDINAAGLHHTTPWQQPSWPAQLRGLMGIPIDHVLVSQHWKVIETQTGPDIGSDHRPVLARLRL